MSGFDDLLNVDNPLDEYGEPMPPENQDQLENHDTQQGDDDHIERNDDDDFLALGDDDELEELEFDNEGDPNSDPNVIPADENPEGDHVQTPEQNAFYAEQRRQQQALERQQELDRQLAERMKQTPEYEVTQFLAQQYGLTPEQMAQQIKEADLHRQAQAEKVPVEFLRQRQADLERIQDMEQKFTRMEFENWYGKQQMESNRLQEQYKGVLTDQDINDAMVYMLNDLKNVNVPLEQVVRMVHGQKIEQHLVNMAKQDALAEFSGRKQSPLAPQGVKSAQADALTPEEQHVARMMGISEKDYLKYRN